MEFSLSIVKQTLNFDLVGKTEDDCLSDADNEASVHGINCLSPARSPIFHRGQLTPEYVELPKRKVYGRQIRLTRQICSLSPGLLSPQNMHKNSMWKPTQTSKYQTHLNKTSCANIEPSISSLHKEKKMNYVDSSQALPNVNTTSNLEVSSRSALQRTSNKKKPKTTTIGKRQKRSKTKSDEMPDSTRIKLLRY